MPNNKKIFCPNCHIEHNWQDSKPWSPFCSKRCKLIDLGDWASEKFKIAARAEFDSTSKLNSTDFEKL